MIGSFKRRIRKAFPPSLLDRVEDVRRKGERLDIADAYLPLFAGLAGIEIGGPSRIFRHRLPIYSVIRDVDGVNFSDRTIWEGTIAEGRTYRYWRARRGHQHLMEAGNLSAMQSGSYEFCISSNCMEHLANPLGAMEEWARVVRPGGLLLIVVPDRRATFDHRRPVTTLDHILADRRAGTGEDDLTHLPEILELHDLSMDPAAGDAAAFRARSERNLENRCLHHHVFDPDLLRGMARHAGLRVLRVDEIGTDHVLLART
jgi:SAM-dependent methyltransferase